MIRNCNSCKIAEDKKNEILKKSDSVFDAVYDFEIFIDNCKKSCKESEVNKEIEQDGFKEH